MDSLIFSIVTDNFLSKLILDRNGFSIIESPLISYPSFGKVIFLKITYSTNEKSLSIFRSTLSGRPVYYHLNPEGEFFCSTHISMLRKAGVRIKENRKVLPEFFVYRYIMPPSTLYKDIWQVPAGSQIKVRISRGVMNVQESNEFRPLELGNSHESHQLETISARTLDLLNRSCKRLKPLNGNVTVLLSGGMDSSILCKICQDLFNIDKTFSTGYPFENATENIEKDYALSAARAFGVRHEYYGARSQDYLHGFLEAISIAEEPLHHLQSVMLYLLFRNGLPDDKNILVSGLGADGIFGSGMHSYLFSRTKHARWVQLFSGYPVINILTVLSQITGKGRSIVKRLYVNRASRAPLSAVDHIVWQAGKYGDEQWVCDYFSVSRKDILRKRIDALSAYKQFPILDLMSTLSFLGSGSVTQAIWSKLGEAHQKILFYPFTDGDLMKYIFSIPWDTKLLESKNILRGVGGLLSIPDHIISRPKSSFGIDEKRWAKRDGVFEPLVPLAAKVFDEKEIRSNQVVEHHKAMTFWNILNYSVWKRLWINGESLEVLEEELSEAISKVGTKGL
jgi:asparagine synthase (glutamine-hydrolysing)